MMTHMHADLLHAAALDTAQHAPRPLAEIEAEGLASRPGMLMIETRGAHVRVRATHAPTGAPTLVLLPDGPNTIEHYDPVFAHFEGRMSVVAIDIPGFGFSYATDPAALTFSGCVDACAAVLETLGVDRLVLTGPCVLAYVAIALAARLKDRALGVVAMQATDAPGETRWVERAIDPDGALSQPGEGQRFWADPAVRKARAVDRWYPAAAARGYDVRAWQDMARRSIDAGSSSALATMRQTWFAERGGIAETPIYAGPARVLFGAADRTHAACGSDPHGLRAYLPRAEVAVLPDAGHFLDLEALTAFAAAVAAIAGQAD